MGIPGFLLFAAVALVSLAMFAVAGTTLAWMMHAWRSPRHLSRTRFAECRAPARSFRGISLLVPARHEEAVLGQTLDRLAESDHPLFEIIAIVGHDDPGTHAVALQAAARHPGVVRVVVDHTVPKNKPSALNTGLQHTRHEIVGVFDAEDDVHPALLRLVEQRFQDTGADVVQGGVQLMNVHTSWWSLRNCLEYYFWFRSRLHFHADQSFIPLGGNTVFVRRDLLIEHGGWDSTALAEDCDLGVRLSTRGAKVVVAYEPEFVTREETPHSIGALIKQRTRWNQGFLQVLRKGEWRALPGRRQRLLARYTLAMPFLQAATGAFVPLAVVFVLRLHLPPVLVLISLLPLVPTLLTISVEVAAYGEFCELYGIPRRKRAAAQIILGAVPYQLLLSAAAMRAVVRQVLGQVGWEKTAHTNLHRQVVAAPEPEAALHREAA